MGKSTLYVLQKKQHTKHTPQVHFHNILEEHWGNPSSEYWDAAAQPQAPASCLLAVLQQLLCNGGGTSGWVVEALRVSSLSWVLSLYSNKLVEKVEYCFCSQLVEQEPLLNDSQESLAKYSGGQSLAVGYKDDEGAYITFLMRRH